MYTVHVTLDFKRKTSVGCHNLYHNVIRRRGMKRQEVINEYLKEWGCLKKGYNYDITKHITYFP